MFASMTLKDIYRKFLDELQLIYSKGESAAITEIVFESHGVTKYTVIKYPEQILTTQLLDQLNSRLQQLLTHTPVQYVTGTTTFYNLNFKVTPYVLIPRPETEELVSRAFEFIGKEPLSILDIGTGSGCIAIALKKQVPNAHVSAIDISEGALNIAQENASLNQVEIDFLTSDFLDENSWTTLKNFDVIISNPPYIPEKEAAMLDKNVTSFEPHDALFVTDDRPLIFYEKIASFALSHLNTNGRIFTETHEAFAKDVAEVFENSGYDTSIKRDVFDKERFVIAWKEE